MASEYCAGRRSHARRSSSCAAGSVCGAAVLKHAIAWPTATLVSDSTRRMRRDCRRTQQNALSLQADCDSPNMSNEGLECWFDRAKPPLLVRSFARLRRIGPPTAGPPLRRCGRRLPGPLEGPSRWGAGALHPVRPSTAQHLSWISARLRDRSTGPFRRKAHSGVGLRPVVPDRRPPRAEDIEDQWLAVQLLSERTADDRSTEYARCHLEVITRFGRFPHRNAVERRGAGGGTLEFGAPSDGQH